MWQPDAKALLRRVAVTLLQNTPAHIFGGLWIRNAAFSWHRFLSPPRTSRPGICMFGFHCDWYLRATNHEPK